MQVNQLLTAAGTPADHAEASSYRASGFSNRIGWGTRPALILIDVCKAYFTPGSPLNMTSNPAAAKSVDFMKRLLATAREARVPITWTQVDYDRTDMKNAELSYRKSTGYQRLQRLDD
ncbi:hypothetical protein CLAFUW4_00076 [Fulvia fulva]|uniref:Uncharacterized protein n=1 Tax=Passalora fulva TaxID=5499 RepID=A0A9Q8L9L4_PASFU|nr:uncharacterized protein CLAFUR5_00074 [Fulvia fulva]KAK4634412.1 hypothetical protein CLAFUR4_00076 [Fulvia fulva]KAK4636666.1 hypothetical protein CLAFUR0_00075 [Fulvia fulva]UJO12713.1 hypothetical protein CLAFUR5_00074 [Fulvia fulva]WPV08192.1 hypothetical protein CLAFUW4_00076 [Fulvia fulva]WPV24526.1 hypothetical protein CLAFUW7_00076 [Fulvia fulva]